LAVSRVNMRTSSSAQALLSLVCQIGLIFHSVASATYGDGENQVNTVIPATENQTDQTKGTGRAGITNFGDGCPQVIAVYQNNQHQDYHRSKWDENVYVKTIGQGSDLVYVEGKWCLRPVVLGQNSPNQDETVKEKCPKDLSKWNMCSNVFVREVSIEVDKSFLAPTNPKKEKGFELDMEWPPLILIIMWSTLFLMKLMETCR